MISIVIPLYNKEKYISDTLRSVFGQSFQDFEVVIVDDGSTDGSAAVVRSYDDPRIRLIEQANGGVSAARNRGIAEARGEYIAFLDADDEWKPDYLATQHSLAVKYPQCSVFAVNYEFRDTQGRTTPTIIRKLPFAGEDGVLTNYFEVASCSHPPICSISIMVRKSAMESIGGFPVGIKSGEDLLTWARLAARYEIAYARTSKCIYNIMTASNDARDRQISDLQSTEDVIGSELIRMQTDFPGCRKGLNLYISFWYKMRAVINLNLLNRKAAFRCVLKSLRYNPVSIKSYQVFALCFMPGNIIKEVLKTRMR